MNRDLMQTIYNNHLACGLLCRTSFKYFIQIFHYYLYRQEFVFKPFHLDIIKRLEDIVFGNNIKRNLLINMPPRMGKSQIMQYFIAWGYAINGQCNFILTSYGDSLVLKFSDTVKSILNSELYQKMFNVPLDKKNKAKEFWKTEAGGELRATSMGGTITGFGAGIIDDGWGGAMIIDDPLKADDYKSEAALANCIDFYTKTLKSRLNNTVKTPIILIMQRLSVDDLTGYILENEADDWEHVIYQGLDEENEVALWPEKVPTSELLKWKKLLPFFYYSQYQQEPIISGGSVIKRDYFRYYNTSQQFNYKRLIITADTAMKVKEHNDYSAFVVGAVTNDNKLHILEVIRGKWEAPDLKKMAMSLFERFKYNPETGLYCSGLYVEDKASGVGLIQELQREGIPIIGLKADRDKLTRVENGLPYIASGQVLLPNNESYGFNPELLSECEAFTRDDSHKHDDMIDALFYCIQESLAKGNVSLLDYFME